jgi:hypothetical protein
LAAIVARHAVARCRPASNTGFALGYRGGAAGSRAQVAAAAAGTSPALYSFVYASLHGIFMKSNPVGLSNGVIHAICSSLHGFRPFTF